MRRGCKRSQVIIILNVWWPFFTKCLCLECFNWRVTCQSLKFIFWWHFKVYKKTLLWRHSVFTRLCLFPCSSCMLLMTLALCMDAGAQGSPRHWQPSSMEWRWVELGGTNGSPLPPVHQTILEPFTTAKLHLFYTQLWHCLGFKTLDFTLPLCGNFQHYVHKHCLASIPKGATRMSIKGCRVRRC